MKKDSVLISIGLPTFNRDWCIERAIKSVQEQTYINWELLIIDDGSTDNTKNILKPYLEDKRIKYFFKKNGGVSSARNLGIKKAKGKYIAFLDSDDEFTKKRLEIQLREMKKFKANFSVCDSLKHEEKKHLSSNLKSVESFFFDQEYFIDNGIPGANSCFMLSRANALLFNEKLLTSEDIDYIMRCLLIDKVLFINTPLVIRAHEVSDLNRLSVKSEAQIKGLEQRKKIFQKNEYALSEVLNTKLLSRLNLSLGFWYLFDGKFKKGRQIIKEGLKENKVFKNAVVYNFFYFISYIPFLFNFIKKLGLFLFSRNLVIYKWLNF